jgi:GrpB-like predicted nucleotidyltransferase (UPF0157 family)
MGPGCEAVSDSCSIMKDNQVPAIYALGLDFEKVRLVPYSSLWPTIFLAEKKRIEAFLSSFDVKVEHVGSTSIPGCPAKPVMDIVAQYQQNADRFEIIESLMEIDYRYLGQCGREGRDFFVFNRGRQTLFHLHLTSDRHCFPVGLLNFRDRLRNSAEELDLYARFKYQLAERYPDNRTRYRLGKRKFFGAETGLLNYYQKQ